MDLGQELKKIQEGFVRNVPSHIACTVGEGIKQLVLDKTGINALKVGDKAPDFSLENATGRDVKLSEVLKNGRVVLSWYRGGWCPYCSMELKFLQDINGDIRQAGATLMALSPELPDHSLSTKEKNVLEFEVLSDYNNDVARQFGVVYTIKGEELVNLYHAMHNLKEHNGVDSNELPVPATYVIEQDFTISYAFVDADYTHRAEPADILAVLRK